MNLLYKKMRQFAIGDAARQGVGTTEPGLTTARLVKAGDLRKPRDLDSGNDLARLQCPEVRRRWGPEIGYFLCAQPIVGKKRTKGAFPTQTWPSGTAYFYKVSDIEECARRFIAIREQAKRLVIALSVARRVHRPLRVQLWGAGGVHERHR